MPPQDVVDRMRRLYRERANDVRFIIPVIVGLSKQEVIELLPRILQLSDAYVKEVISRLLRGECLWSALFCHLTLVYKYFMSSKGLSSGFKLFNSFSFSFGAISQFNQVD